MKLRTLLSFFLLLAFSLNATANTIQYHPEYKKDSTAAEGKELRPGACEIELINYSQQPVFVIGSYDSNVLLDPFSMAPNPYISKHLSLNYYGYCHDNMFLQIYTYTFPPQLIYSNYPKLDTIINVHDAYANKLKVELKSK